MNTKLKIQSREDAQVTVNFWKDAGQEVVFTNGCFDILHLGHVDYLEHAKNLGNRLIVGLNTDKSVRKLKGSERPITNEDARARIIASLEFVDLVVLFEEDTPLELITELIPDVLVKGKDYELSNIVGAEIVLEHGGSVQTIDLVDGYSTTNIVEKLKKK